ncbi:phosphatase PAP2 family protein [Clostridium niameyense]|uniref:phosphatase PAP2 family protein n=1 Tax=Clostridium niameyense TaxID=1622073 RepID=UPI00067EF8CC|nr:phosphatase PAP2 family protein [Clostridium niameyense]
MNFIQNIDISILNFIQEYLRNGFLDNFMPLITRLGDLGIIWVAISLILILSRKYRKIGLMCLGSLILSTIIGEGILKHTIQRSRPFVAVDNIKLLVKAPTSFSFPSGHSFSSFAVATVIANKIKKYKIPVYILASLIVFSRLYLYVHYPSDVLVGVLLGIVCAKVVCKFYKDNSRY